MDTRTVALRTPRGLPVTLHVREGTSDLAVAGSVFADVAGSPIVDEYRLAGLHVSGSFADVGAHIGCVAVAVLLDNPDAEAVLVEPVPENVAMIRANLDANGLSGRARVIEGAVGTDAITYGFTGSEVADTNRYIGNLSGLTQGERIAVRRVGLDDLLPCSALKIDCEGGEWALFDDPAITGIPVIFGEYHGGEGVKGILRRFARTHAVEFDDAGATTGTFRAILREVAA